MLPTHSGTKAANGVSGIPTVNKSVALSLLWIIVSIGVIIFGFRHCSNNSYKNSLICDDSSCILTLSSSGIEKIDSKFEFDRSDFKEVQSIKIDSTGAYVDSSLKKSKKERLSSTLRFRFMHASEEIGEDNKIIKSKMKAERIKIFGSNDIGRRLTKSHLERAKKYIEKKNDKLSISSGKGVTVIGILSIFFGIISLIASSFLGQFSDPTPRRLKKSA
jgi:hypothetical protein